MNKGRRKTAGAPKQIETLTHTEAKRKNIPTAELQSAAQRAEEIAPFAPVVYPRRYPLAEGETRPRDADLDPQLVWKGARIRLTREQIEKAAESGYVDISDAQLVWRGKDQQDWSDLVVNAPPLYIQEKIHPKAIIDDLVRRTKAKREAESDIADLFQDFNGIDPEAKTEFYQHDQNWSNRFILGDSLQVMASLAERENLRGKVQCIYFDPPYGIKFNSNWQVSTRSRDVKDGKIEEISREPEQVRAFRDTWKDGIHSYLTYLRDRLTAMRDLLTESGSIFVQIGDENVHRVRALMDEVFQRENLIAEIVNSTTTSSSSQYIDTTADYILWYAKDRSKTKYRALLLDKVGASSTDALYRHSRTVDGIFHRGVLPGAIDSDAEPRLFRIDQLTSQTQANTTNYETEFEGKLYPVGKRQWATPIHGMERLKKASRVIVSGSSLAYVRFLDDYSVVPLRNIWMDTGTGGFTESKVYVVQTGTKVVQRCILMASDPGDLVLDPTCGSGTTPTVAEQWGRRWITIDTSRVALALARARVMSAKYPYYLLADSKEGLLKEAELTGKPPVDGPTHGDIRQGFVYDRAQHITLKSIANNAEIDVIWEEFQATLEPLRRELNAALGKKWEEWEISRAPIEEWSANVKGIHKAWWEQRIARQKKINESIAKKADVELLYDRPCLFAVFRGL
nr:site-specific DNA-methyltransferase [Verrucomicrobium sp. 3C]